MAPVARARPRAPRAARRWSARSSSHPLREPARGCARRAPRRRAPARGRDRAAREVALDRRLVAAGDRAGERVRRRARPSSRRCAGRAGRAARGRRRRRRLEQLGRGLLEGDQEVGGDRRGGVVGGARLVVDRERPHPEPVGQLGRELQRRRRGAGDRAGRAGEVGVAVGDRLQRVEREGFGAGGGARAEGVEAAWRRWCGRRSAAAASARRSPAAAASISASGTQSKTASAPSQAAAASSRPTDAHVDPGTARCARERAADAAGADDREHQLASGLDRSL